MTPYAIVLLVPMALASETNAVHHATERGSYVPSIGLGFGAQGQGSWGRVVEALGFG